MVDKPGNEEPPMEEVLASIRKLMNEIDDEDTHASDAGVAEPEKRQQANTEQEMTKSSDKEEDVLELTRMVREDGSVVDVKDQQGVEDGNPAREKLRSLREMSKNGDAGTAPAPPSREQAGASQSGDDVHVSNEKDTEPVAKDDKSKETADSADVKIDRLASDDTAAAASDSFEKLHKTVVKDFEASSETLEGMVAKMLRPMLQDWLDKNLEPLVERLVDDEIARLSRNRK